jgi:putative transposase
LLLTARLDRADETDAAGATPRLAGRAQVFLRMTRMWVDGGDQRRVAAWGEAARGWRVAAVPHPTAGVRVVWGGPGQEPPVLPTGFRVLTRRWVVERTFAWLGRHRRLSKDDEALPASEDAWISAAATRLLRQRLAAS